MASPVKSDPFGDGFWHQIVQAGKAAQAIEELADDNDTEGVLAVLREFGINGNGFVEMDERPGQFSVEVEGVRQHYRQARWHMRLRRVRNSDDRLFDILRENAYASYGWRIERDLLAENPDNSYSASHPEVGVTGPSNINPGVARALERGEGERFRMKDDDGEVYYIGRYIGPSAVSSDMGLRPLDDFGTPNAGCTSIEFWVKGKGGGWKVL